MIATASNELPRERYLNERSDTAKNWFARYLRKSTARYGKENEMILHAKLETTEIRPQTAPSAGISRSPMYSFLDLPPPRPRREAPPRPPRPDSDVIRDVNAWLDASMSKPAPQLMGGLPYWREGPFTGSGPSAGVRYAVPIPMIQGPLGDRPSTSHGEQVKAFCRRAKRMQVRMPSLLRTSSQRITVMRRKQPCRRSSSMPLLALGMDYNPSPSSRPIARYKSLMNLSNPSTPATVSSHEAEWLRAGRERVLGQSHRLGSSAGNRFDDQETNMERHVNAVFGQVTRGGDTLRPPTAKRTTREDSLGDLSDAPTYFTGPPPPSYRSRAASIRSTSSFGCVDGMNRQRQPSQQHSARRSKGVKGKFKKLAQKARINFGG
jgi:hypothetical protein